MKRFGNSVSRWSMALVLVAGAAIVTLADQPSGSLKPGEYDKIIANLRLIFSDDFESGGTEWVPGDPQGWRVEEKDGNHVYSQLLKKSNVTTPHRSPYNWSLIKGVTVGDFVFDVWMHSTVEDYNHRDMCLFFGYQDPAHFYYVHFARRQDDRANQIFIVDGADRKKISATATEGTPWTDGWHHVRLIRDLKAGSIKAFFDDMQQPAMTATDSTFEWGQVGVGSFDDTGEFDNVLLYGQVVEPPAPAPKD